MTTAIARCQTCGEVFVLQATQALIVGDRLVSARVDTTEIDAHMLVHAAEQIVKEAGK